MGLLPDNELLWRRSSVKTDILEKASGMVPENKLSFNRLKRW